MIAPNQVYKSRSTDNPVNLEDRYGFRRCLAVVKATVPVIDVADLLCGPGGLRRVNTHWFGRCPLPDHEDKTPSFVVYPDSNSWWCFGCSRGGAGPTLVQASRARRPRDQRYRGSAGAPRGSEAGVAGIRGRDEEDR